MKKVIGIVGAVLLMSSSLNASEVKNLDDFGCVDTAFDYADSVYEATGDGFRAGSAFDTAYTACIAFGGKD